MGINNLSKMAFLMDFLQPVGYLLDGQSRVQMDVISRDSSNMYGFPTLNAPILNMQTLPMLHLLLLVQSSLNLFPGHLTSLYLT